MNFDFSEEQTLFADSVRRFALAHLAKGALERAHNPRFPFDVARMMAEQGLMGITIAEDDGGQGGTLMDAVIAIEQIAQVCRAAPTSCSSAISDRSAPSPIRLAGAEGEMAAAAPRRPHGHELGDERARRRLRRDRAFDQRQGGRRRLRPQRHQGLFPPSARAKIFLIYVRYAPGLGGIGSVIVERDTPGFRIGAPSSFMSDEEWSELHFDDCRIPRATSCSGPADSSGRFPASTSSASAMRRARWRSGAMPSTRRASTPRPASSSAGPCANSRACSGNSPTWRSSSRARSFLLYRAAANADRGLPSAYETAIAKSACNLAGFEVAHEAVQAMGAMGYSRESLVEWCMRRTRGWMIAGGSIEMMKNRIAEHIFDRRFNQRGRHAAAAE